METNNRQPATATARTVETLTVFESHQFVNVLLIRDGSPKQFRRSVRNYALALFMLDAGLRVGETCKLLQSDLLFKGKVIQSLLIRPEIAKYKVERTVPLSSRLRLAIQELSERVWDTNEAPDGSYAFYLRDAKFHLTERQAQRIIADASLKSIGRKIHPHILRHTFATKMMRYIDIRGVQDMLGHKLVTSTQIYTHPSAEDKKNAVDKAAEEG